MWYQENVKMAGNSTLVSVLVRRRLGAWRLATLIKKGFFSFWVGDTPKTEKKQNSPHGGRSTRVRASGW